MTDIGAPRVLVTGNAGYIGSQLVGCLLSEGYGVVGVDNLMYDNMRSVLPYLGDKNFLFFRENVASRERMKSFVQYADVIIPLAAIVGAPACDKNPAYAKQVNYEAIRDMVKDARKDAIIMYPNTNSGYGQTDGKHYCTEDEPMNPVSVYGRTKCDAEKAVLDHPNPVVFRLATVFGASPRMRMDLMVNDFTEKLTRIKMALNGHLEIFEPHFWRNYVHVRDVCRAFLNLIGHPFDPRGAFNLGHPEANLTKLQLAHKICEQIRLTKDAVVIGDGIDSDRRNYLVSNERILATGFKFLHSLEDGILEVETIAKNLSPAVTAKMRNV